MKVRITRTDVGAGREIVVEVERASKADQARWAAEDAARYKAALAAIEKAPDEAAEIAREALDA